ncbi:MAG: hypothetical protein IT531_04840 [Burkholderiales bacterium]|nr:hypothetical protein [Burkholderiales bacterium]
MRSRRGPRAARTGLRAAALVLTICIGLTAWSGPCGAQATDTLAGTRHIAAAGAIDLALSRIERGQPKQPGSAEWEQWEALRWELLAGRGRDAELLARVKAYREYADRAASSVLRRAARAAIRLGDYGEARGLLARLFVRAELRGEDYRDARLGVIETYAAERNADAAYHAMLRFQQDFAPLRQEEAERFVAALVELERINDAAQWLSQVDPSSPWAAILRLRAGLLKADAAIAQARAALAKSAGDNPGAWALLAAGGQAQGSSSIAIEVAEQRLNAATAAGALPDRNHPGAALWRRYSEAAQAAANRAHLLSGDDAQWLAQASRMAAAEPQLARALLAHLALKAGAAQTRAEAQLKLLGSMRDAKLVAAAVRLFDDGERFPIDALDSRVRLELGKAALEARQPLFAVRLWRDLPPSAESLAQWQLRQISALVQAGKNDDALAMVARIGQAQPALAPELQRRAIELAVAAMASTPALARALFSLVLPVAAGAERVQVLTGLAQLAEADADFRTAADAYLQAATLSPAQESDRAALAARAAAAANLVRAGLRADARALYQWLVQHAKDAAIKEAAAQALKSL